MISLSYMVNFANKQLMVYFAYKKISLSYMVKDFPLLLCYTINIVNRRISLCCMVNIVRKISFSCMDNIVRKISLSCIVNIVNRKISLCWMVNIVRKITL